MYAYSDIKADHYQTVADLEIHFYFVDRYKIKDKVVSCSCNKFREAVSVGNLKSYYDTLLFYYGRQVI